MDTTIQIIAAVVAIIALGAACVWLGHHLGAGDRAKLQSDLDRLKAAFQANVQQVDQQFAQATTSNALHGLGQVLEHPIQAAENALEHHHLTSFKAAAAALWDDTKDIAEKQAIDARIAARAQLRAEAQAVMAKLAAPAS